MNKFTCPCSNVTLEVPENQNTNAKVYCDQIQALLNENTDGEVDTNGFKEFIKTNFDAINSSYMGTKLSRFETEVDPFDSQLKIKFPLLIGILSKDFRSEEEYTIKLNRCLVCDVATHCTFALKDSAITQSTVENEASGDTQTFKKPSVLENRAYFSDNTLSHSSIKSKNNDAKSFSILVNIKQMILNFDIDELLKSENYSSVYDIVLDDKKEAAVNLPSFYGGFTLKINEAPIFEQRIFLNQIDEKYRKKTQSNTPKEEGLRYKFENLVNRFMSADPHRTSQSTASVTNSVTGLHLANKIRYKATGAEQRKKYDESALSSSVFEMEEIDEFQEDDKFLSEQDSQDELNSQDELENKQQFQRSILKKRNSNIGETEHGVGDMQKTTAKLNFSKPNLAINRKELLSNNQYSCSLPRDIPIMMTNRLGSTKTSHKEYDNNENYYNPVREQQKHHSQLISNSYKPPNSAYMNYEFNDEVEGDDDLFEDENEPYLDEDGTSNMGQAISSLASSIVIKDGRELFGGVPSRRVPINSISKSCYE